MKQVLVHPDCSTPAVADRPSTKPRFLSMSELLTVAVADARALDPRLYQPNYIALHDASVSVKCQVCLAGCLIAGTLQGTPDQSFAPEQFNDNVRGNLSSLNYMRQGKWLFAFYEFHRYWPRTPIENRLRNLPKPDNSNFRCWNTYHSHLDSLESILPELREIEIEQHWR